MAHVPTNSDPTHEPVAGVPAPSTGQALEKPRAPHKDASGANRPPQLPQDDLIGPFLQFITTDNDAKVWRGSALTLHRANRAQSAADPKLTFDHEIVSPATESPIDVLYEDVFGMKAMRWNLAFRIPDGTGDELVKWTLEWPGTSFSKKEDAFHIAKWNQPWRGGAFSCNGFDETVPDETIKLFGFDGVWKHLNSIHTLTPLHTLIWGGDQIYIDLIFQDVPWLTEWLKLEWDQKWKREFPADVSEQVAKYYMSTYCETWLRPEVVRALGRCPALMQWDDHDIFDGAGSYPPECHDSPVMLGLVRSAQKFRLLFQHHTTPELAHSKHGMWGKDGHCYVHQCGPQLAMLNIDGRTERDAKHVLHEETWDMIFEHLDRIPDTTQHLLAIFAVPFSFIRVPFAESFFEFLKNRAPWVRKLPGFKGMNSIFDLPEFYDDLLDEWSHDAHIEERNKALVRLQQFAQKKSIRVTLCSGDVHCAAMSRFRSDDALRRKEKLVPSTDPKLMFQFISSAIVNQSPSANACMAYHFLKNKWHPVDGTDEETVEMFERRPEGGKAVRFRKFMPNRNWLYFEMIDTNAAAPAQDATSRNYALSANEKPKEDRSRLHLHHRHSQDMLNWSRSHYFFDRQRGYPSTLGPVSGKNGLGSDNTPLHRHRHGPFCHHRQSRWLHRGKGADDKSKVEAVTKETGPAVVADASGSPSATGLKVRMWLESRKKEADARQFSSYEIVVPDLEVGPKAARSSKPVAAGAANAEKSKAEPAVVNGPSTGQQPTSLAPTAASPAQTAAHPPAAAAPMAGIHSASRVVGNDAPSTLPPPVIQAAA